MSRPKIPWYFVQAVVILYRTTSDNIQAVNSHDLSAILENDEENNTHVEKSFPPHFPLGTGTVSAVSPLTEPNNTNMELTNGTLLEQDYLTTPFLPNEDLQTTRLPVPPILLENPKVLLMVPVTSAPARVTWIEVGNVQGSERPAVLTNHVCGQMGMCEKRSLWLCEISGFRCHPCRCDEGCFQFGDCCPDKYNFTGFRPSAHPFSCVSTDIKPQVDNLLHRYLMVDKCNHRPSSVDQADNCKTPFEETVPVYSPQTKYHYKNRYCALCNGVQDTVPWPVKATCRAVLNYSKLHTSEDFFLEAWQNPSCGLFAVPPEDSEARECSYESSMVSECRADWTDRSDVTDCQKYLHPVTIEGKTTYKNVFCAKCNGVYLGRKLQDGCHPVFNAFDIPVPHSQADDSDFLANRNDSNSDQCPNSQVFDIFQAKCRDLFCPLGKVIKSHMCEDLFSSAKGIAYKFNFALIPTNDKGAVMYAENLNSIFHQYLTHIEYINTYARLSMEKTEISLTFSTPDDLPGDHMLEGFRVFNITVKRRLVVGEQIPRSHLEKIFVNFVRQGWSFYNEPKESFEEFHAQWLSESTEKEFLAPNYTFLSRTNHLQMTTERRVFHQTHGPVPADYLTTSSVYLPVNELMNCNLIELSPEEFEAHGENSIVEKATGKVLVTGQYLPVGKAVRVCTDFTGNIVRQERHGKERPGQVQRTINLPGKSETTITLTCTGLSLFFILLTFVCHAFNSGFRSLTSKSNMAFFVNLFCAQLSLLLSIVLPFSATACNVLGAIVHYFWLSTFFWALSSFYLLYQMFSKPFNRNNTLRILIQCSLFNQLTPLVLVTIYMIVHVVTSNTLGYGKLIVQNSYACFFQSTVGFLGGYIVPVCLLVLLSTLFLIKFLRISDHDSNTSLNDVKFDRRLHRSYCTVMVVIICTWLFGSLAVCKGGTYLWNGFLLIHSSVGVFVMYSFSHIPTCFRKNGENCYQPSTSVPSLSAQVNP